MTNFPLPTGKALHVLQFTDSHLLVQEDGRLKGTATWQTFQRVIEHAIRTDPQPDFILATGDLVHDGPRIVYQRFRESIARMGAPIHVLPGNHDEPALLAEMFMEWTMGNGQWTGNGGQGAQAGGHGPDKKGANDPAAPMAFADDNPSVNFGHVNHGNWLVVLLNTMVSQKQYGQLSPEELDRLETLLHEHPHSHALLCLHHHPVPFGRAGMDSIGLRNAEAFFSIVDHYANVRGIVWGHIHNAFEAKRGEVTLFGTPSTCFQFNAASEQISPTEGPPGYRRLVLESDGGIHSDVVWVS
ncbi:MAG: phosphodiesterase [Gammaproteobacteria bacterium]|nr:phosphodiesterase [Gammaproteobacteria bacterium]NNJ84997.1 phosphodiesterase [Gammaproteobacteria bacterium]